MLKGGMFCDMVNHTGKNAENIKQIAKQKYDNISRWNEVD